MLLLDLWAAVVVLAAVCPRVGHGALLDIGLLDVVKIAEGGLGGLTPGLLMTGDSMGETVAGIGDLDGDGVGDIVTRIRGNPDIGVVLELFLNSNGTVKSEQKIGSGLGGFEGTLDEFDEFGWGLGTVGVHPVSGRLVVAVGAWLDDDGGLNHGAVWLLELNANGTVFSESKISDTEGGFEGTLSDSDFFGFSVCVVSSTATEFVLAVGAPQDDDDGLNAGAVWLVWVAWSDFSAQSWRKINNGDSGLPGGTLSANDKFGSAVASAGDVDGDGVGDLLVGAINDGDGGTTRGAVYVLLLNAETLTVKDLQKISSTQGGLQEGTLSNGDNFGASVASIGDANDDGVPDIVVGAPNNNDGGNDRGALHILFLNTNGTVKDQGKISSTSPANNTGGLEDLIANSDQFASSVAFLGDHNGDGVPFDIIVGGPHSGRGSVFVLFLNGTPSVSTTGTTGVVSEDTDTVTDTDTDSSVAIFIVLGVVGGIVLVAAVALLSQGGAARRGYRGL